MSDDKDGSDWLASQFDPTEEVPKQPAPVPPPAAPATPPAPAVPPAAAVSAASVPPAAAPPVNPAGGFNWGLRPGGGAEAPAPPSPPAQSVPPATVPATPPPTEPFVPVRTGSLIPPTVEPLATEPATTEPSTTEPEVDPGPPTQAMTQPLSWDDLAGVDQPTAAFTVPPWEPATASQVPPAQVLPPPLQVPPAQVPPTVTTAYLPTDAPVAPPDAGPADPTSALDSLFAEHKFQEYEDLGVLQAIAPPASTALEGQAFVPVAPVAVVEHAPISTTQRTLMIIAGSLIAVIALVALFFLGQRLGAQSAQQATPAASGAATNAPVQAPSNGLAAPGVQPFSALQGGECLQPFTSAWSATYTVIDCGSDHAGQLVFKGTLPDAGTAAYPTGAQFQSEITPLCTAPTSIDYGVAKSFSDLQVSFSYPPTAKDWDGGDRTYYCFVNRSSGDPLSGDLAAKKP